MHRPRRLRILLGGLAAALLSVTGVPANAQSEAEINQLEGLRAELGNQLAGVDAELAVSEVELEGIEGALRTARVRIELLADDFERAVDQRRIPAATRVQIAIAGFTNGDPRQNAVLDEIRVLSGLDDTDPSRARELYSAVIEDTEAQLDEADNRLRQLTDELGVARSGLETLRSSAPTPTLVASSSGSVEPNSSSSWRKPPLGSIDSEHCKERPSSPVSSSSMSRFVRH